jgi:hypothetical protein
MSPYEAISSDATQGPGPNYTAETSTAEATVSVHFPTQYCLNANEKPIKLTVCPKTNNSYSKIRFRSVFSELKT